MLSFHFLYLVLLPEAAPALAAAQQNDRTCDQYNCNDKRARQDHRNRGAFFFAERLFEEDLRKHIMLRRKAPVCLLVNRLLSCDPPVEFEHLVAVFRVYQVVIEFLHVCELEVVDFVRLKVLRKAKLNMRHSFFQWDPVVILGPETDLGD